MLTPREHKENFFTSKNDEKENPGGFVVDIWVDDSIISLTIKRKKDITLKEQNTSMIDIFYIVTVKET